MKNCLILGSGRSGTSMLAGILHQAGYFMGDRLHKPEESNPKGFFEWMEINSINETILANCLPPAPVEESLKGSVYHPLGKNQKWLLSLPPEVNIHAAHAPHPLEERIKKTLAREPFSFKDPRFSYTLPVWAKYLKPGAVFICVFREPDITVNSILKECAARQYLSSLNIRRDSALDVWFNIYAHILYNHAPRYQPLVFVHYNQIFNGAAIPALARLLDAPLQTGFVDENLKRTLPGGYIPEPVSSLYRRLCHEASYS